MKYIKLILLCLLLVGCVRKEKIYEDTTNDFVAINTHQVEVYKDLALKDILEVKNKDIEVTNDDYVIDTNSLGDKEIVIYYTYDKKKYLHKDSIKVIDSTPPLVFSGTSKTIEVNYDKDICDLITYGDNYSGDVNCKISGNYDLSKIGSYKLLYTLSDSSNNETNVDVTLNVVDKLNNNTTTSKTKTYFKDIYNLYKNENTEVGIDVSRWQEDIDFKKVKEAGASFVMMRLGVQSSDNEVTVDSYYEKNIKKAKEAGLKVGVYLYSIATSKEEAINQADFVLKTLNKEKLDLPIVFDWESWSSWNSFKISFHDINEIADAFIEKIEDNGYKGMLYSSKFYLETIWINKKNYPVWLAHYTKKTDYAGEHMIWQLCNNGRINGINGDVDIDIMYNNK